MMVSFLILYYAFCFRFSPLAVFCMIAVNILKIEDISTVITQNGWYIFTVVLTLLLHGCLMIPLLYFIVTKKSPIMYIKNMSKALFTAFATASR